LYPNYIVCSQGAEFADVINASNISIQKINNSFSTMSTSLPLTLWSVSNNETTGLRVPTFIDSQDLGALTIGYNQSAGFINVCRATRFYSNILTDSNINGINATDSIVFGNNITTGNLRIGNTTMTGNVCITTSTGNINFSTAGDVTFNSDIRSTWNTSDLTSFSTQLGSGYSVTGNRTIGNISGTNACRLYYPAPANISLLDMPVGLYMVTMTGSIRGFSGYDAIPGNCYAGICYGTNASFTDGNTTRVQNAFYFAPNLYNDPTAANASCPVTLPVNFTFPINMSVTGRKIGVYIQYQAANLASQGSVGLQIFSCAVTKIA
jgi:hypothetical protein